MGALRPLLTRYGHKIIPSSANDIILEIMPQNIKDAPKQVTQPWTEWVDAARAAIVDSIPLHKVTIMAGNPPPATRLLQTPRVLHPEEK
jgi:hypothetical protein